MVDRRTRPLGVSPCMRCQLPRQEILVRAWMRAISLEPYTII
jgi:hypothetical protein